MNICCPMASRTRSATKINHVLLVSGSDLKMAPVDLAVKAEDAGVGKNYCYR